MLLRKDCCVIIPAYGAGAHIARLPLPCLWGEAKGDSMLHVLHVGGRLSFTAQGLS